MHLILSFQVSLCWFDTPSCRKDVRGEVYFRLTKIDKIYREETNNHDGDLDGDSSEADSEGVILQNLHVTKSNALTC